MFWIDLQYCFHQSNALDSFLTDRRFLDFFFNLLVEVLLTSFMLVPVPEFDKNVFTSDWVETRIFLWPPAEMYWNCFNFEFFR